MSFASMLQGLNDSEIAFVVVGGLAATAHGSRRLTDDLDICYDTESANIERLASLLAEWKSYPRGIEPGLPFFMDERQFGITPVMTLTTKKGFLDVLDRVKGVGDYESCAGKSIKVQAFGIRFRVLDLPALIAAKKAAGRPKDIDQLPELEALIALKRSTRA